MGLESVDLSDQAVADVLFTVGGIVWGLRVLGFSCFLWMSLDMNGLEAEWSR